MKPKTARCGKPEGRFPASNPSALTRGAGVPTGQHHGPARGGPFGVRQALVFAVSQRLPVSQMPSLTRKGVVLGGWNRFSTCKGPIPGGRNQFSNGKGPFSGSRNRFWNCKGAHFFGREGVFALRKKGSHEDTKARRVRGMAPGFAQSPWCLHALV